MHAHNGNSVLDSLHFSSTSFPQEGLEANPAVLEIYDQIKENADDLKRAAQSKLQASQPWEEFFDPHTFGFPSKNELFQRIMRNLQLYSGNYFIIALAIFLYVGITNIFFISSMTFCAFLGWFLHYLVINNERFMFRTGLRVTPRHGYGGLGFLTIALFYLTGGSKAIFNFLMGSSSTIFLHATLRQD